MHPPVSFHACKNYFSLIHHHPFRTHENTHAAVITLRISVRFVFFSSARDFSRIYNAPESPVSSVSLL